MLVELTICGDAWIIPACGFASISRAILTIVSAVIRLSASSTSIKSYSAPQRLQKSSMLPDLRAVFCARRR